MAAARKPVISAPEQANNSVSKRGDGQTRPHTSCSVAAQFSTVGKCPSMSPTCREDEVTLVNFLSLNGRGKITEHYHAGYKVI